MRNLNFLKYSMDFLRGFAPRAAGSEIFLGAVEPEAFLSNKIRIPSLPMQEVLSGRLMDQFGDLIKICQNKGKQG